MSQSTITNGRTTLTPADLIQLAKDANHDLYLPGIDFYGPFARIIPPYAKAYSGSFYEVSKNSGDPSALTTTIESLASGKVFEEDVPADCVDDGITSVDLFYNNGTDNIELDRAKVVQQEDEAQWEKGPANDGTAYWRMAGRKLRLFFPIPGSSQTPKKTQSYKRYPTIPTASSDYIDAPAEDVATLIEAYKAAVHSL